MSFDVDVVVVGAGAGGIGAAKTALAHGLTVRVLEAKDRIGGRAFTEEIAPGTFWDHGAYWLHDAPRNFYVRYAEEIQFAFDRSMRSQRMWGKGGWADADTVRARDEYVDHAFDLVDQAGFFGKDIAASEVIPDHPRFGAMFRSWYAAITGADPEMASTLDQSRYQEDANWRVKPGYGALVARYANGLPVSLATPATCIRWNGSGVEVETPRGTIRAQAVIVTVSTAVMVKGGVRFDPALPPKVAQALADVPLGAAEKVAFGFSRDVFGLPENSHVHFDENTTEAIRFHIKLGGGNSAVGYLAGKFAEALEAEGDAAMIDFAERKLTDVFGRDILKDCVAKKATHWRSDPHILGGYSAAKPGKAEQRWVLKEPVADRIYFAGEACCIPAFGTVHGAHAAGVEAARTVAAALHPKS